jgi:hypothetical protein
MEQTNPEDFYELIQKINNNFISDGVNVENYPTYYNKLNDINHNIKKQMDQIVDNTDTKEEKLYNDYRTIFKMNYLTNWCLVIGICLLIKIMFDSSINISMNK